MTSFFQALFPSTPTKFAQNNEKELILKVPTTEPQKEIWASVQMGKEANLAFNLSYSLSLKGDLDLALFKQSIQQVIQRYESLRTTFSQDGETLLIASALTIEIPVINLINSSEQEQKQHLDQVKKQAVENPFDLENSPLFRVQIIQLKPQEFMVIFAIHHIICDGFSWSIMMRDLNTIYSALKQGIKPELEEVDSFSEYASLAWKKYQNQEQKATEEFWVKQFTQSIPILDIPTDRPRPAVRTFNSASESWVVPESLVKKIKQFGAKSGCTLMITLLAGFEVFLHRITGQDDIIIGVPASGQTALGKYNLAGHCVNLLPIRTFVDGAQTFRNYLKERQGKILDAYEHQDFTFGRLIQQLKIKRDPSRIPLVPIIFSMYTGVYDFDFFGCEKEQHLNPRCFDNFELSIDSNFVNGKLILDCQYNTNLFDAQTIRNRLAEFETLLTSIVEYEDLTIAQLPLLPASEKQLLQLWNQTDSSYTNLCFHQLFEQQVMSDPDQIAVVFAEEKLTYQELNEKANQLAHYLRKLGVKSEVLVGVSVERSLEMIIAILGIMKAGGVYVPLDPTYPQERLDYMISDAQLSILITQSHLQSRFAQSKTPILTIDRDWTEIETQSKDNPSSLATIENLVYVIYTSGSTGKPKGVSIMHQGLCNLAYAQSKLFQVTSSSCVLQFASFSFDASISEIAMTFVQGATLCLGSKEDLQPGMKLIEVLQKHQVTHVTLPPSALAVLPDAELPHLQCLIVAGESCPPHLVAKWAKGRNFFNAYGPTEATVCATAYQYDGTTTNLPIGKPIANYQIYLLDPQLQPVAIGVVGEIHIGSWALARGYLNRPELTQAKFIPNPFGAGKLYKTGDLGRYLPDGNIQFLGRNDHQVKIRGFRIEVGEIEALLAQHPAITEVVVILREDTPDDKRLVAYYVSTNEQPLTTHELREYLGQYLPPYMIPSVFMLIEAIPLTLNGKLDRDQLPIPEIDLSSQLIAPRNEIEQQLAQIWQKILHLKQVGIKDDFFEIGGHSLFATQVIAQILKIYQVELSIIDLFETPTIEKLGNRIEQLLWVKQEDQNIDNNDFVLTI